MKSMIENNGHVICLVYFTGVMNRDLTIGLSDASHEFNNFLVTGMASSIVANHISYHVDIRGPSLTVDTACSSALVSIHLGSQAIQCGECTLSYCHFA
jgi:acyl transferase domain-containing protein